jgi:hypothetical protein
MLAWLCGYGINDLNLTPFVFQKRTDLPCGIEFANVAIGDQQNALFAGQQR